jgi:hypothetical protein
MISYFSFVLIGIAIILGILLLALLLFELSKFFKNKKVKKFLENVANLLSEAADSSKLP